MTSEPNESSKDIESLLSSFSETTLQSEKGAPDQEPGVEEVEGEGEEAGEGEEDQPDGPSTEPSTSSNSSNSKKNKKKKLAAKLKKKLGGSNVTASTSEPSSSSSSSGTTSHLLLPTTSSSSSSSGPQLSAAQYDLMRKTVEKETSNPNLAKSLDNVTLQKLVQAFNQERHLVNKDQAGKDKSSVGKDLKDHKFWNTQPVIKPSDGPIPISDEGPIEPNKPADQVRSDPYPLPKDFEWVNVDIDDPVQLQELFELLHLNYVEDDDAMMRFKYSPEFLHWVLKHPGYDSSWHVGVRVTSSRKLVAFISGIPHELRVRHQSYHSTEINFLCVHKKLRSKRLAPVLIKEVTRKCNLTGIFQAIYTGGIVLPTPISCSRYYHRTLNPEKLCEIGFAAVPSNVKKEAYFKRFELEKQTDLIGLREMEEKDVAAVGSLLRRYMRRFDLAPRFTDQEIRHLFLSGRGKGQIDLNLGKRKEQVTWTYVVENPETGKITDMFAFYSLPSSILNHPTENVLHAAYLFYYASDSIFDSDSTSSSSSSTANPTSSSEGDQGATNSTSTSTSTSTSSSSEDQTEPHLEEWQRSAKTGLNRQELKDEEKVVNWNDESREMKKKLKVRLNELMHNLLILTKKAGFDVVNCLTVMDNQLFIQDQLFGPGDGFLRFYLFNWRVAPIAGGMGNRPGETDHDPLFSSLKEQILSRSSGNASSSSSSSSSASKRLSPNDEEALLSSYPKAEWGSGNGIVMV